MKIVQKYKIFANIDSPFARHKIVTQEMAKDVKTLPKWRHLITSGHTGIPFLFNR